MSSKTASKTRKNLIFRRHTTHDVTNLNSPNRSPHINVQPPPVQNLDLSKIVEKIKILKTELAQTNLVLIKKTEECKLLEEQNSQNLDKIFHLEEQMRKNEEHNLVKNPEI